MAAKGLPRNPTAINDLLSGILDPVLRKRAGLSLSLVQSWQEVVGPFAASRSRPEKIVWPRAREGKQAFAAATLVIACEASAALELQHETGEIIARVNAFLGHDAVGKVKLVQKRVHRDEARKRPVPGPVTPEEADAIARMTRRIDDEGLRAALDRLGASVRGTRRGIKTP